MRYSHQKALIKRGKASRWLPYRSVKDTLKAAGLV
jgi:hypothetical protein